MSKPIEDYALLSDGERAALVSRDGSIDWLCLPRFDSPACFAALVGESDHGYWRIRPEGEFRASRRYVPDTLVLETTFETKGGRARLVDSLVIGEDAPLLLRKVEGVAGEVALEFDFVVRFDYGSIVPWVRKTEYGLRAIAGPDEIHLETDVSLHRRQGMRHGAEFSVREGETLWFALRWNAHFRGDGASPDRANHGERLDRTVKYWREYADRATYRGPYVEAVKRSILTLKALIYDPTGAIVAAPTTSLPERIGGERNWDYRYCWIRDSTFSLYALLTAGYRDEARRWREWLIRAVAGTPSQVNIMYGIAGERRLPELELEWLGGYEGSKPVRTGNAAYRQLQLDVFGEAIETLHLAMKNGIPADEDSWRVQSAFIDFLEKNWDQPDEGIWEVRGPRQHYAHSKIMAWVAVDRAIRSAEMSGLEAPLDRWRDLRERIHADVCRKGFNEKRGAFTQYYGSNVLDASLLMAIGVGFLPPEDPRIVGTVKAIEEELFQDGFVLRYKTEEVKDVLHGREGCFLPCSFWLVDAWILMDRREEAEALFRRLVGLANDLGLLSEEYDPVRKRLVGNFPQALSHIALINSAYNLELRHGPARDRSQKG
ncbi:MAG: glycoside hydrolase family 15 protein [Bdellovibrionales bacterium]|nr:glycoside hydrolase family 15 protein [Bdellovibrionales bacterium]